MYQYIFYVSIFSTFDCTRIRHRAFLYPRALEIESMDMFQARHHLYAQGSSTNVKCQLASRRVSVQVKGLIRYYKSLYDSRGSADRRTRRMELAGSRKPYGTLVLANSRS